MPFTRNISAADRDEWRTLWQAYLDFYQVKLSDAITEGVWQRLLHQADPLRGVVLEKDGQLLGFSHYFFHGTTWNSGCYCYLEDLFVCADSRNIGAGRALIMAVKEQAKQQGAVKLYWHTDKQNNTAQALYNKVAEQVDFLRYDLTL